MAMRIEEATGGDSGRDGLAIGAANECDRAQGEDDARVSC